MCHKPHFLIDNPVAQKLLIKQLERFGLCIIATSNGEEAIAGQNDEFVLMLLLTYRVEWESHEPGFFSAALFDHRECT